MFTRLSFLPDMVQPSEWEHISMRISAMLLSSKPDSRTLMKYAVLHRAGGVEEHADAVLGGTGRTSRGC